MPNNEEHEFRDRLYDYTSPADAEATWLAVQEALEPQPKRRVIGWWIPLLLLLFGAVAFGFWQQTSRTTDYEGTAPITKESEPPALTATRQFDNHENLISDTPTAVTDNRQPAINENEGTGPLAERSGPPAPIAARNENEAFRRRLRLAPPDLAKMSDPSGLEVVTTDQEQGQSDNEDNQAITATRQSATRQSATDNLPWPAFSFNHDLPTTSTTESGTFKSAPHRPWSVAASGTLSSIGQFQGGPEVRDPMVSTFGSIYRPLEAVTGDLLLGYRTRNGWTIRSGVSMTRLNSVVELTTESSREVMSEGIIRIMIDGQDTTVVMGLIAGTERSVRTQRYHNRLTLIDVPVLIGRDFTFNRWRLGVEVGPVFNLRTIGDVRYLQENGEFSAREDSGDFIRSSLGVNFRAGLYVGFRLTDRLELTTGINWRNFPRPNIAPSDELDVHTDLYGGSVGFRFQL